MFILLKLSYAMKCRIDIIHFQRPVQQAMWNKSQLFTHLLHTQQLLHPFVNLKLEYILKTH